MPPRINGYAASPTTLDLVDVTTTQPLHDLGLNSTNGPHHSRQETFLLYAVPVVWAIALFIVPLCGLFFFAAWNLWELAQQYIVVHHEEPVA